MLKIVVTNDDADTGTPLVFSILNNLLDNFGGKYRQLNPIHAC